MVELLKRIKELIGEIKRRTIVRVIAGSAKNRKLKAPSGQDTRPITSMIKEALFNVLGSKVNESSFLDLFAGSGSVGIEAISRGASQVFFVDNSYKAIKVIKHNLDHCGFSDSAEVYKNDVFKVLDILNKKAVVFDIIYIDPPFNNLEIFDQVMSALDKKPQLLAPDGVIIIRSQRQQSLPDQYINLVKSRLGKYGESVLHYYIFKL